MATGKNSTVAVGLSGGVDSSVAAFLLQRQGYNVIGLTMQIWDGTLPLPDEGRSGCYGPGEARDIEAAQRLAQRLGIPHHVIPLAREYTAEVLDYFRREYRTGRTPNPCVRCNRGMKFGLLLDRARAQGLAFDRFATGHYARVEQDSASGRWLLRRAVDLAKDQSYFLSRLSQEQLRAVLFPLGGLTKPQVKAIARELGWADVADKPESQNFIESKHYGVLFGTEEQPGPIMDLRGNELGRHRGIAHYTVGQRKGLGLGGTVDPLYVIRIDACSNTVIVGPRATLLADRLVADDLNWIGLASGPREPLRIQCKIRQQHQEAAATLRMLPPSPVSGRVEHKPVDSPDMLGGSAGASPSQRIDKPFGASVFREGEPPGEPRGKASQVVAEVVFDEPQMAITPGQTAVFYDQDRVLGSGIIVSERTNSSNRSTS